MEESAGNKGENGLFWGVIVVFVLLALFGGGSVATTQAQLGSAGVQLRTAAPSDSSVATLPSQVVPATDTQALGVTKTAATLSTSVSTPLVSASSITPSASARSVGNVSASAAISTPPARDNITLTTLSPQNIEKNSATLRSNIVVPAGTSTQAVFVYGYDQALVAAAATQYTRVTDMTADIDDRRRFAPAGRVTATRGDVSASVRQLALATTYYYRLCANWAQGLVCSPIKSFTTNDRSRFSRFVAPQVRMDRTSGIGSDQATVSGSVTLNDAQRGTAFIVYGEDQSRVSGVVSNDSYSDVNESGDNLQKIRVASNMRGSRSFSRTISSLDDETDHYYRLCVEYDGDRDGLLCSNVQRFKTFPDDYEDVPTLATLPGIVLGSTLYLQGSLDMDEYRNGVAFFVYGTSESAVAAVPGERAYTNVRQQGDALQRAQLDVDVDRSEDFVYPARDLLPATAYYFSLCVAYERLNQNYRETQHIECAPVRSATTP